MYIPFTYSEDNSYNPLDVTHFISCLDFKILKGFYCPDITNISHERFWATKSPPSYQTPSSPSYTSSLLPVSCLQRSTKPEDFLSAGCTASLQLPQAQPGKQELPSICGIWTSEFIANSILHIKIRMKFALWRVMNIKGSVLFCSASWYSEGTISSLPYALSSCAKLHSTIVLCDRL